MTTTAEIIATAIEAAAEALPGRWTGNIEAERNDWGNWIVKLGCLGDFDCEVTVGHDGRVNTVVEL